MKSTQQLHDLGQSLWLDNITRQLLTSGTLRRYIGDLSVTGLTSNPSIFDLAIKDSNFYDEAIRQKTKEGKSGEALFFELALEDLTQAAEQYKAALAAGSAKSADSALLALKIADLGVPQTPPAPPTGAAAAPAPPGGSPAGAPHTAVVPADSTAKAKP